MQLVLAILGREALKRQNEFFDCLALLRVIADEKDAGHWFARRTRSYAKLGRVSRSWVRRTRLSLAAQARMIGSGVAVRSTSFTRTT